MGNITVPVNIKAEHSGIATALIFECDLDEENRKETHNSLVLPEKVNMSNFFESGRKVHDSADPPLRPSPEPAASSTRNHPGDTAHAAGHATRPHGKTDLHVF